ncbi:MAG: hypothetical protein A2Y88_01400 [Chloroflexi bacterium RBG_13_48_10]|jgi:hypothetical protein|nr:MAG: hypothetical protein A2Y88_01400 [Chloroflexi bacterium RBG_13_48_10]
MNGVFTAYDRILDEIADFYQKLNTPIHYPDGMVVVIDTIYWGRVRHYSSFMNAIPHLKIQGIEKFSQLLEASRTPGRMKKLAQQTGISAEVLRILKHDIEQWLPKNVALSLLEPIQKYKEHIDQLTHFGIIDQLQMISMGQTPLARDALAQQTGIPFSSIAEIVKCCDFYRTGTNLSHIRSRIYYEMGLDTWQKWADSTAEGIIAKFADYVHIHNLETVRLIPWPREVRNGIEWARLHLGIFKVEW